MTNATISFGPNPDETWAQYDIHQHPILFNNQPTRAKAIIRGNDLISIAGKGYTLLPNEEALKLANEAAELAGFIPYFENIRDASWKQGRVRGHVLNNEKQTQMHALFVPKDTAKGGISLDARGKDTLHVGVDVVNSIDGKKSFGIGAFSFRHACKNGVIFGQSNVDSIKHPHTQGLKPIIAQLKTLFVQQMDKALMIAESYKLMTTTNATPQLLEKIKKSRIPDRVLPGYIAKPEENKTPKGLTVWQVYNDITAGIWHNPANDLTGKEFQFGQLHRAIPITVKVK